MNIYRILQRCLNNNKNLEIKIFNKYQTYSFYMINSLGKYYLFFNEDLIDVLTFCSYILAFEILISTDTFLYSDCFLDYGMDFSISTKSNALISTDNSSLGIKANDLELTIKNCYRNFCQFNNILTFPKKAKIEDIKQHIYKILTNFKMEKPILLSDYNFFHLLANKITDNFSISRNNLIELFANTMLNNQDLVILFNLKNVDYNAKFSFTSANNLQVEIMVQNVNHTYIGLMAFAILYALSVIYDEDYEDTFSFQKVSSSIKRTNRQVFLNACLLNELINQNKENSAELLQTVHNYYQKTGIERTNLLFLFMDVEKEIKGDSEFQDYTQNKATMQNWIKKNANTLLGKDNVHYENSSKAEFEQNKSFKSISEKEKKLTRKPKLIYWPTANNNFDDN